MNHDILETPNNFMSLPPREVQDYLAIRAVNTHAEIDERLGLDAERVDFILQKAKQRGLFEWDLGEADIDEKISRFANFVATADHCILGDIECIAEVISFREHMLNNIDKFRMLPDWNSDWAYLLLYLNAIVSQCPKDIITESLKIRDEFQICYGDA